MASAIDFIGNTIRFPDLKGRFTMMTPAGTYAERQQSDTVSPQTIWKFYGGSRSTTTLLGLIFLS